MEMMHAVSDFLWGQVLIVGLLGGGVFFTVASRFVQFRYFGRMFTSMVRGMAHEKGQISSFQALMVSVGGRVGGGNIAGVAVAISLGGPGAVFWMWVVGLIGMSMSLLESSLAQLYKRREPDGSLRGGPAYYMRHGIRQHGLAMVYSVLLLITFGLAFNAVQSFVMASSLQASFGVPTWTSGLALVAMLGLCIFGGIQRIAAVAEFVVPFMAAIYLLCALVVLGLNLSAIDDVLVLIFNSAFGLEQAVGGGLGGAIMLGIKRGLFSNEAGLGSAPNVAATAVVPHPLDQGLVQALSVFIDTIILCTCTAIIILLATVYQPGMAVDDGVVLTQTALAEHVGGWGDEFISVALTLFAFSSILYNYYLGENALNYFSEENQALFNVFRVLVLMLVLWGAMQDLATVFGFADLTMAMLGVCNLVAIMWMFRLGLRLIRDYDSQLKQGHEPRFNPDDYADLDIDPSAWK